MSKQGIEFYSFINKKITEELEEHNHSVLVGKHCAYCMDCGAILIEYKKKSDFMRLMNPFDDK